MPVTGTHRDRALSARGSWSRRVGWGVRTTCHQPRCHAVGRQNARTRSPDHQSPHVPVCHQSPQTDEDREDRDREPTLSRTVAPAGVGR